MARIRVGMALVILKKRQKKCAFRVERRIIQARAARALRRVTGSGA